MTDFLLFALFALTLLGIARFHAKALPIALGGLCCVLLARLLLTDFDAVAHLLHEWRILANLAGLLLGFAVLAAHFEHSHLADRLTGILPAGRLGAFALLVLVAVLSAILDNIAAALIGGSAALTLFRRRVHVGYLAAIVAAANAGGAGSVIGDTTTTMLWIEGASPLWLVKAGIGAAVAVLFFGAFASRQQHALQPLAPPAAAAPPVDLARLGIVLLILAGTIATNLCLDFPAIGVWAAILFGCLLRPADWRAARSAIPGTGFLLSLVLAASMMPVEKLPEPTTWTTLGLGFVSAIFDNIPLTKLAIEQGGYDWGLLAFAVGYGGSMLWFGSSAGVAIAGVFHEAKSVTAWLRHGWHVAVGYVLGFLAIAMFSGFEVHELRRAGAGGSPPPAERGH
ncbi:MAG: SLC13 family permease [Planctomycetota bacterium]